MSEPSNKLCNRYDVLAWGGAVLALITLAILPASVSTNFLTAVFAFISLVGFLMVYMKGNLIAILLIIGCFFLVVFILALQSDDSGLSGTAYLANFGSYFGGVMTPVGLFVAFWAVKKQEKIEKRKVLQQKVDIEVSRIFQIHAGAENDMIKYENGEDLVNGLNYSFYKMVFSSRDIYLKRKAAMDAMLTSSFAVVAAYDGLLRIDDYVETMLTDSTVNFASDMSVDEIVRFSVNNILSIVAAYHFYGEECLIEPFDGFKKRFLNTPSGQLFLDAPFVNSIGYFYNYWERRQAG